MATSLHSAMRLPELTKPQWDAAMTAARLLMSGDPNDPTDRATFRNAKARFADLLPDEADANDILKAAVRWSMANDLAASLAMVPGATVALRHEPKKVLG